MTLPALFRSLWRRWVVVLLATLVCGGLGLASGYTQRPMYKSSITQYFTLNFGKSAADLSQGATYTSMQMTSFATLVTSPAVLQPVVDDLHLPMTAVQLGRQVTATTPRNSAVLNITVRSDNAKRAADIANDIAVQSKKVCESYSPTTDKGKPSVLVYTIAPAQVANSQYSPNKRMNLLIGLLAGVLLGAVLALLLDALDRRLSTAASVESKTPGSVLATLSRREVRSGQEILASDHGPAAEEFRQLRAAFEFASFGERPFAAVVTSPSAGEGKTTVAANLAASLSEGGDRVLLMDADLRQPRIAAITGLDDAIGLTDVLVKRVDLATAVQHLDGTSVDVLVAGSVPPNPGAVVASQAMRDLLADAKTNYDVVVIDAAPVLPVADGALLAQMSDGFLVVANAQSTRRHHLVRALDRLSVSRSKNMGVVLNQVRGEGGKNYTYESRLGAHAAAID